MGNLIPNRRDVIVGGTLGISSLALPRAAAATSGVEPQDSGESIVFSETDQIVVAWYPSDASAAFPNGNATLANTNAAPTGVSGSMGLGGPYSADSTALNTASSGIAPTTDGRHWYDIKYQASSFSTADPAAPYWRWTITAGSPGILFSAFVLGGFNAASDTTFSLRSSVDGYTTSLRDFTGDGTGEYRRVVINLSSLSRLSGNNSITFRLYVRRTNSTINRVFLSGGSSSYAGLTASDTYDVVMDSFPIAFIGSV